MRRLLAYTGLLLVLAGCGIGEALSSGGSQESWVDLTPAILVGSWHSTRGDTIEFTAGGEFYADDVKYMFANGDQPSGLDLSQDTATASGYWSLLTPLGDPDGKHAFAGLGIDVLANQPTAIQVDKLLARHVGDAVELGYNVGDPDLHRVVSYRRCARDCPRVAPDLRPLGVPTPAKPGQLVGVWRDQRGARLTLAQDGGYEADDLRFAYVGDPHQNSADAGPLPSTGTWSTKPPQHDPSGPETTVVLGIVTLSGRPSFGTRALRIYTDGPRLVLATLSSNPDVIEQHVFHRDPPRGR